MTDQPAADEIRYFVERVRSMDRDIAVNSYVRTGATVQGAPDPKILKVLLWLDELGGDGESGTSSEVKP